MVNARNEGLCECPGGGGWLVLQASFTGGDQPKHHPAVVSSSKAPNPTQKGLPEGHTRPCYPLQSPGVGQHRVTISRDQEAAALEKRRNALVAAATNVRVGMD